MNWKNWLKGLVSAFIGAAANGVTLVIVDPTNFNIREGLPRLASVVLVSGVIAAAMYLKQSPLPKETAPLAGSDGFARLLPMGFLTLAVLAASALLIGCANTMPSRYDTYEGCLICDIAKDRGVRLEDVGNALRIAGAISRAEGLYSHQDAVEVLTRVRRALDFQITGATLVGYVDDLKAEYAEVLDIALSYAGDLAVEQYLDDRSVAIMRDFLDRRIAYLSGLDPAARAPES